MDESDLKWVAENLEWQKKWSKHIKCLEDTIQENEAQLNPTEECKKSIAKLKKLVQYTKNKSL